MDINTLVKRKRVGVISLGCDKNRVDTEKMLSRLKTVHEIVSDVEVAEIVIINTCAFLKSSRQEAIDEILSVAQLKNSGKLEKLIVSGCMPQKFLSEIYDELVEVDGFLGVSDYDKVLELIDILYQDKRASFVGETKNEKCLDRVLTTDNYAYLKIADGCSNHCTYCLIPKIRGKFRSHDRAELIEEAKRLGRVNELILVAQDTAKYGQDLPQKCTLTDLIRDLSALENVKSIRLLYCYPENITDELINEFKVNAKLVRYIDVPLQHADDNVLKLMNRKGTGKEYLKLINRLKTEVKGIAIRSTFITGFPSETEESFENLVNFIKQAKLFNVGFFKYSREEGTPAYKLDGQIKESVKTKRLKKLYSVQKGVVRENNKALIGKTFKVLAEGFDEEQFVYYGRPYFYAPEIDGKVFFFSSEEVEYGKYYDVKITKATGYDLYGGRV